MYVYLSIQGVYLLLLFSLFFFSSRLYNTNGKYAKKKKKIASTISDSLLARLLDILFFSLLPSLSFSFREGITDRNTTMSTAASGMKFSYKLLVVIGEKRKKKKKMQCDACVHIQLTC